MLGFRALLFYKKWEMISVYCHNHVMPFAFQLVKENFKVLTLPKGVYLTVNKFYMLTSLIVI